MSDRYGIHGAKSVIGGYHEDFVRFPLNTSLSWTTTIDSSCLLQNERENYPIQFADWWAKRAPRLVLGMVMRFDEPFVRKRYLTDLEHRRLPIDIVHFVVFDSADIISMFNTMKSRFFDVVEYHELVIMWRWPSRRSRKSAMNLHKQKEENNAEDEQMRVLLKTVKQNLKRMIAFNREKKQFLLWGFGEEAVDELMSHSYVIAFEPPYEPPEKNTMILRDGVNVHRCNKR